MQTHAPLTTRTESPTCKLTVTPGLTWNCTTWSSSWSRGPGAEGRLRWIISSVGHVVADTPLLIAAAASGHAHSFSISRRKSVSVNQAASAPLFDFSLCTRFSLSVYFMYASTLYARTFPVVLRCCSLFRNFYCDRLDFNDGGWRFIREG